MTLKPGSLPCKQTTGAVSLTRSLPRDVYKRRKNGHPGGQGQYTSNLNFVFADLSKPGHRRGCCCMFPRCLLRQFVDRCLLSWALFIEKTVLQSFTRCFCPNGGKQRCGCSQMRHKLVRAVRLNAFATMAIEERAGFVLLKAS